MSKLNWLGIFSVGGGLILLIFQSISSMMTTGEIVWKSKTLLTTFGEDAFHWVSGISWGFAQSLATSLVNTQLYILLIALGVLFFIAGAIFQK